MNINSVNSLLENGFSYLLASDFDQTLSFNDSGYVLCDLLGIRGFEEKVAGARQVESGSSGRRAGLPVTPRS
jgi:hypothetical protein